MAVAAGIEQIADLNQIHSVTPETLSENDVNHGPKRRQSDFRIRLCQIGSVPR
jgi:hypothetical protein